MKEFKRIEFPLTEVETMIVDEFIDDVQKAYFAAITEELTLGDATALIVNKAHRFANRLEFGEEEDECEK